MEESAAEQKGKKKGVRLAKKSSRMSGESPTSTRELNSSSLETTEAEQKKKKSLPVIPWMRDPVDISRYDPLPVDSLPFLDSRLKKALHNMGISSLFPVQKLSTRFIKCLRALVVLPTRDLALQVKEVFDALAPAVGLSVGLAVGQSSIADEIAELIRKPTLDADIWFDSEYVPPELRSAVDILVATPGRLMDHINNTKGFT
ncbi:UNVERIFIED_CONTAM: DEAD-box ATP-dependent RNA helicase 1 [Sesamum latifolium]|uniref:ATP-dependent RNA helicase n=1 Tax=Sesamum latifolium TaxID=2727402 RepID=A0AAW2WKT8_9LAMI